MEEFDSRPLGAANLRFFSPARGEKEFAWVPLEDLVLCFALSTEALDELRAVFARNTWLRACIEQETAGRIVTLIPSALSGWVARNAWKNNNVSDLLYAQYILVTTGVNAAMIGGLSGEKRQDYVSAAETHDSLLRIRLKIDVRR